MFDTKPFLKSTTIWGGVVAILAALLGLLGYSLSAADQAELIAILTSLGSAIGGALAIWGRVKATKRIG